MPRVQDVLRRVRSSVFVRHLLGKKPVPKVLDLLTETELRAFYLDRGQQIARIRQCLVTKGKGLVARDRPRVFVAVQHVNWERPGLVDGWADVAEIVHYDWGNAFGFWGQYAPDWHKDGKPAFNEELVRRVEQTHRTRPVDLFFSYLSGRWVYPETIRAIGSLGIITVNISLDDSTKFWGYQEPGGLSGNAETAPEFDVCVTCQSKLDVSKYVGVGANPLFLPPGGNPSVFSVSSVPRDIPLSFVGQCYGRRPQIVEYLRTHSLPIQAFGKGWPGGELSLPERQDVYARSLINLGFGYIGDSKLVGLKGRDFEVPLAGGLYLTTYNSDLEDCFVLGQEIECYRDQAELADKVRFYIARPDLALEIGAAGRLRCLRDHTWQSRFQFLLKVMDLSIEMGVGMI
jgi:spore maturation protein CgeB